MLFSWCIFSLSFGLMISSQRYNQDEVESVNRAGQKHTNKTITCNVVKRFTGSFLFKQRVSILFICGIILKILRSVHNVMKIKINHILLFI